MFTAAIKLIEKLSKDPEYSQDAEELYVELLDNTELPKAALETFNEIADSSQRVDQLGLNQAIETFTSSISTALLKRFPECALVLAACGKPSPSSDWKALRRYAREHLFGTWELASGQPMPKKSMVLVDRQDLIKQLLNIESAILNALEDELSEENEERLQRAFRRLVEMRIKK